MSRKGLSHDERSLWISAASHSISHGRGPIFAAQDADEVVRAYRDRKANGIPKATQEPNTGFETTLPRRRNPLTRSEP